MTAPLLAVRDLGDLSPSLVRSIALDAGPFGPTETERAVMAILDAITEDARAYGGVAEMAAHAGLGLRHFERLVWNIVGTGPQQYHNRARLEQAQNLLALTDLPLTAVAVLVGYSGQPGLAYLFNREIGMTPGAYREQVRP